VEEKTVLEAARLSADPFLAGVSLLRHHHKKSNNGKILGGGRLSYL
jgi:hypothetical protein